MKPTIIPLDASSLKMAYCQRAYTYAIVRGLREKTPAEPLTKGKAIHLYAELITRHPNDMLSALSAAKKEWQKCDPDIKQLIAACGAMPNTLPKPYKWTGPDGSPREGIELFFRVPWLGFTLAGVSYQIDVMGTIDLLSFDGTVVRIVDYKTSRKYKAEDIFRQYENDTQVAAFYPWVFKKFGHLFLPPEIVAAVKANRLTSQVCAVQISGLSPRWILAPPASMSDEAAADFEAELRSHIHTDIIPAWTVPDRAARNGWVSGQCGNCRYNTLCHASPEMTEVIINNVYEPGVYNPQNFGDTPKTITTNQIQNATTN